MTFVRLCIALEQQASSVTPATWNRQQHPAEACRLPGLVATAGCTNTAMANSMVPPILTFLTGWPNDKINGRFCTFTHSHTATAIHDCQSTAARAHHAPPSQPKALLPPQVACAVIKNFYVCRRSRVQTRSKPGTGDQGGRCTTYM